MSQHLCIMYCQLSYLLKPISVFYIFYNYEFLHHLPKFGMPVDVVDLCIHLLLRRYYLDDSYYSFTEF